MQRTTHAVQADSAEGAATKFYAPSARKRRRIANGSSSSKPFSRPSGRTGAAKGFEFLKDGGTAKDRRIHFFKLRALLRLIPTTSALEAIPSINPTLRAKIAEVYPYVWNLANPGDGSRPGVEVKGVGAKTEDSIRGLLTSKGVKVSW